MFFVLQLLADGDPAKTQQQQGNPLSLIFLFLPILFVGYLFLIRPQQKQQKELQKMLSAMKKNDKVETIGGIIGIVANVNEKEDEVTLKVDENSNVRMRFTRKSIVRIINPEPPKEQKEGGA
jgi:preprotein translocase subunit YajC